MQTILLMEEILHQLIGSLSHYLQGFMHPRWCRISSINSMKLLCSSHTEVVPDAAESPCNFVCATLIAKGLQWLVCRHKTVSWCNKNLIQLGYDQNDYQHDFYWLWRFMTYDYSMILLGNLCITMGKRMCQVQFLFALTPTYFDHSILDVFWYIQISISIYLVFQLYVVDHANMTFLVLILLVLFDSDQLRLSAAQEKDVREHRFVIPKADSWLCRICRMGASEYLDVPGS